jgi:Tol biopolymer transport system component
LIFGTGTSEIAQLDWRTGKRDSLTTGPGLKVAPHWLDSTRIAYGVRGGIKFTDGRAELAEDFQAPDWSPDQRTIVFQRETDRRGDRDRAFGSWPSPDGRFSLVRVPGHASFSAVADRLVYLITNITGDIRNGALVAANADGSNRTVVYEGPVTDDVAGPSWSPGGDRIIFGLGGFFQRAQTRPARLMSIRPDGTGLTPLTEGNTNDGMPSWSPDAKQAVYRVANGTTRQLEIVDVATGARRKLETGSDYDTFPSWSPRGDWIVFTSKRDADYELYRIRPDGTGLQRLTRSPGADAHPTFSPDGQWIAFATGQQGFKDEAVQLLLSPTFQPYGEIAVMRSDGSDLRLLTDNSTEEGTPSWVPSRTR